MLNPEEGRDRARSYQRLAMEVTRRGRQRSFLCSRAKRGGWPQISKVPSAWGKVAAVRLRTSE